MTANTTKTLLCLIACVVMAASCHNHAVHDHEGHDHGSEVHNHAAENHDHEAEVHEHASDSRTAAGRNSSSAAAESDHDHEGAGHANSVHFTSEQARLIDFSLDTVALRPAVQVIKTVARVLPVQTQDVTIVAKSSGVISMSEGPVLSGIPVTKGRPIALICSEGLGGENMAVRLVQAKAAYEQAREAYERKSRLAESRIVSQAELQAAIAEYETTKAEFENLDANMRDGAFAISSDINGRISEVLVRNGDYVEQGTPVLRIQGSTRCYLEALVPLRYYPALQNFETATFTLPGGESLSLPDARGRLVSIASATLEQNSMLPVTLEIDSHPGMISGSFLDTYLLCKSDGTSLSVSKEAIIEQMGSYFTYRMIEPELYQKTQVHIGWTDGNRVEITSGLNEGDIVVGKGAIIVKLAQDAGGLDPHAGHVH